MKEAKTIVIRLISGKPCRIEKADINVIHEQLNIDGKMDTEVFMKTGYCYLTRMSKTQIETLIKS